jgi:hypothetical protein
MMRSKVAVLSVLLLSLQGTEPNQENFARWRDYIRPKATELAFEQCDWKAKFWDAVVEAQRTSKPILLWAMNGHPMACT